MKNILCIAFFSIWAIGLTAQPQRKSFERIHAAKVAYITDRLQLSSEQSQRFWPVFNEFESERMAIRRKYHHHSEMEENFDRKGSKQEKIEDEDHYKQSIDDNLDLQQEELDLKRKYKDEFLKILSAQQLSMLFKTEKEFRQLLIQRLREKRGGGRHWDDHR